MSGMEPPTIVVVGAGISGLTAAYKLCKTTESFSVRPQVIVFDSAVRAGGVISTMRRENALLEKGPESFITTKPAAIDLVRELHLSSRLIHSNAGSDGTSIGWQNDLHMLPDGFVLFAPTKLSPLVSSQLFSWAGKLRMALEPFIPRYNNHAEDETLANFVLRRMGKEVLERLAEPLLSGIYAGAPEILSAAATVPKLHELERDFGSVSRGLWANRQNQSRIPSAGRGHRGGRPEFVSFDDGMQVLIDGLCDALPPNSLQLGVKVLEVVPGLSKRWRAIFSNGGCIEADAVIIATPAKQAAAMLSSVDHPMAAELSSVDYSSAIVLSALFNKYDIGRDLTGSGFVVPRSEGRLLRACTFSSLKFSGRSDREQILLRLYPRMSGHVLKIFDEKVICERLLEDAHDFLDLRDRPIFWELSKHAVAIPQYTVGHRERMAQVQRLVNEIPGLALAGNAYNGVGVPDCILSGTAAAQSVCAQLQTYR